MKKWLFVYLISIGLAFSEPTAAHAETEILPQNQPPSTLELAFLRRLGPDILHAMEQHDDNQLFTANRIEKIIRNKTNDYYDVTVRVVGYEGPINPPYKWIRITFRIPDQYVSIQAIMYEHKIISPEEFKKLSEFTDRLND